MFSLFKKKPHTLLTVCEGKRIVLQDVKDPTFADEMIGKGSAIEPRVGHVCAPCDGRVSMLFPTLHAIGITTDYGAEILIHIGIDTVNLNGDGFESLVKENDVVKVGQELIKFDLAGLKAKGYDMVIPVLVCNPDRFKAVKGVALGDCNVGEAFIEVEV